MATVSDRRSAESSIESFTASKVGDFRHGDGAREAVAGVCDPGLEFLHFSGCCGVDEGMWSQRDERRQEVGAFVGGLVAQARNQVEG